MSAPWLRPASLSALLLLLAEPARAAAPAGAPRPVCASGYADVLTAMGPEARRREANPAADWVYCLRATAVYEHLAYGRGGRVRHQYFRKVRHGTGFAYRAEGGRWLVATNQHVVAYPDVTRADADVEGVPAGSRKVRESVKIVASEADADGPGQIALEPVVADEALDVAVLASRTPLRASPYRLGRSADLRVGDAVLVRGFPLGAFAAANGGRVISVGQRDVERGWDHVDFAVDALLNPGNSGSPVLAVSCRTGEPEIVGVYHAGYRGAQGLHVVIGIDEVRAILERLRPAPRPEAPAEAAPDRAALREALARSGPVFMPFGGRTIRASARGEAVRFALLDERFPLSDRVELELVDRGLSGRAGLVLPAAAGDDEIPWRALGPAAERASQLRDALWLQLGAVIRFRAAQSAADALAAQPVMSRIAARLHDREEEQGDLLSALQAESDAIASSTVREPTGAVASPAGGSSHPRPSSSVEAP